MKKLYTAPFGIARHLQSRRIEQVIENRTAYTFGTVELSIYETQHIAERVEPSFSNLVLASMIRGKKIMHLPGTPSFEFMPGESAIIPGEKTMHIDFSEAQAQCLTLAIAPDKVQQVTELLNDRAPLVDNAQGWTFGKTNFFLTNDAPIHQLITRLIHVFTENNRAKEIFANLVLQELLVRLMQTQARSLLLAPTTTHAHINRLAHVAHM